MVFLGILFSSQRGERKILDASQGGGGRQKVEDMSFGSSIFWNHKVN